MAQNLQLKEANTNLALKLTNRRAINKYSFKTDQWKSHIYKKGSTIKLAISKAIPKYGSNLAVRRAIDKYGSKLAFGREHTQIRQALKLDTANLRFYNWQL